MQIDAYRQTETRTRIQSINRWSAVDWPITDAMMMVKKKKRRRIMIKYMILK